MSARRKSQSAENKENERIQKKERMRSHRSQMTEEEKAGFSKRQKLHRQALKNEDDSSIPSITEPNYLGPMDSVCTNCGALFFAEESGSRNGSFSICCNFGNVVLANKFDDYPEVLRLLLTSDDVNSKNFRENIRQFNSAVAMASMGAQLDIPRGHGPYCFRIHGQVYHLAGPLHNEPGQRPQYGQIYILDTKQAADERLGVPANVHCNRQTMERLSQLLTEINPYAKAYRMMAEIEAEAEATAISEGKPTPSIKMIFDVNNAKDKRRYNYPTANEVAVVYVGEDNEVPTTRSLAIHPRNGTLTNIKDIDPVCDPLTYPIYFPRGQAGWSTDLQKKPSDRKRSRITQKEYYCYLLQVRKSFNPLFYGGPLFQQYIVDSWVKIEANRLNYHRTHQSDLRADQYKALQDYVLGDDDNSSGPPGKRIILPSSYAGSPRAMVQNFQDAMAIVSKYGKPDFFITFTCNAKWKEIQENLNVGQTASDRPDLVARVFKMKVDALFDLLLKKHHFGNVKAYVSVYEWQKRGLPHIHMILIMEDQYKPRCAADVDKFVCAEIPDKNENPKLFAIVSKMMIHRPCGDLNPEAPCMHDGFCSKHFPKVYCDATNTSTDGYPEYRRRNDGRTVPYSGVFLDNCWVVPYNPELACIFEAHINVEILIQVVKYLFKYMTKGPDRAELHLSRTSTGKDGQIIDEISAHLDTRYVCAPEGIHHILGFEAKHFSDTVYRLAVHLPDEQTIRFHSGHETEAVKRAEERNTTLTAWFQINKKSRETVEKNVIPAGFIDSRAIRYIDMPSHFTYNKESTEWNIRKRYHRVIGRMYTVSPQEPERYALRLMLLFVTGAESFEHLKTVDNEDGKKVIHPTFFEAAKARGLLNDDTYFLQTLKEAAQFHMPQELRSVFVAICAFNEIHNLQQLWEISITDMGEDFRYNGVSEQEAEALVYYDVYDRLSKLSKQDLLSAIPEPTIHPQSFPFLSIDPEICKKRGEEMYSTLNEKQKEACDAILSAIDKTSAPRLFFVDGPGGSGKTYLYQTLFNLVKGRKLKVVSTAWTGIAANLLPEGRTSASLFKLNINEGCKTSVMKRQEKAARDLSSIDLLIWDECSMIPKNALSAVDELFRDLTQIDKPFGGKIVVLGGDFRQILPVVKRGSREDTIDMCIKRSSLWNNFSNISLTKNMRVNTGDSEWIDYLLSVGNGEANDISERVLLPPDIVCKENIVEEVFGNTIELDSIESLSEKAILAPKNVDVDFLNSKVLSTMDGNERTYFSNDDVICEDPQDQMNYPAEFLHTIRTAQLPPHKLILKKECVVMLLRNLDVTGGLCNGTRLVVKQFGRHCLGCVFACGDRKGRYVIIPRIDNYTTEGFPFRLRRRQFPIRLAFALSINKSQGQSFNKIGLWLPDDVFAHGQLYVALSRVRSRGGLIVQATSGNSPINIVYREIL